MYVPWWVSHHNLELAQYRKIECPHVAVYPLALGYYQLEHPLCFLIHLLLLLDIVDVFAVGIVACVQVRAISHRLVRH